ncbi:MAG TPA: hypothetical protein VKQ72_21575, partial [Aggregatilineales bacterium]|nr:hypothetical protein [Aggregatilineales bacterium]
MKTKMAHRLSARQALPAISGESQRLPQPAQSDWEAWIAYFQHNAAHLMEIGWQDNYELTSDERRMISASVQQFQLGESSEGKHVLSLARRYVVSRGDENYLSALKSFIREEQRHSQYLARFMETQNISLTHSDAIDSIFRCLRHIFNLELSIMAMLTAE